MAGSAYNVQRAASVLFIFFAVLLLLTLHATLSANSHKFHHEEIVPLRNIDTSALNSTGGMKNKLFVIIVAGFRTGSTLLGEFFNQNPAVTYIFEPLHQTYLFRARREVPGYTAGMSIEKLQLLYLEKLLENCDTYTPAFFWKQMNHLICSNGEDSLRKFGNTNCARPSGYLSDLCNQLDTTVLKTIRVRDIGELGKIKGIENRNVKIIHLLRDPRGLVNSRCFGFPMFYLKDSKEIPVRPITNDKIRMVAEDYCEREIDNLILTDDNMPGWLKGKYLRVTHTDLSLDPKGWLRKIYGWLDMPLPKVVKDYVADLENIKTVGSRFAVLSVKKNSKKVLVKWQKDLQPEWIQTIQEECSDVMERLNITKV